MRIDELTYITAKVKSYICKHRSYEISGFFCKGWLIYYCIFEIRQNDYKTHWNPDYFSSDK